MWSCNQSLVTLAFLWEKLASTHFYIDLTRKINFLEWCSWFKLNNLGLALGIVLKFYKSVANGLKLKVRKFWGLVHTFVKVTREKLVGGGLFGPPSWIWLTPRNLGVLKNSVCYELWLPASKKLVEVDTNVHYFMKLVELFVRKCQVKWR